MNPAHGSSKGFNRTGGWSQGTCQIDYAFARVALPGPAPDIITRRYQAVIGRARRLPRRAWRPLARRRGGPCATPCLNFAHLGAAQAQPVGSPGRLLGSRPANRSSAPPERAPPNKRSARLRMRPLQALCRRGRLATIDGRRDVWTSQGRRGASRGAQGRRGASTTLAAKPWLRGDWHTIIAVYITLLDPLGGNERTRNWGVHPRAIATVLKKACLMRDADWRIAA
jgi:hypothetical protein